MNHDGNFTSPDPSSKELIGDLRRRKSGIAVTCPHFSPIFFLSESSLSPQSQGLEHSLNYKIGRKLQADLGFGRCVQ